MLYIIRHGQTTQNKAQLLQGRSDLPLNENGISQAKTLGAWFAAHDIRFDRIYSSPLCRAIETAKLVSSDVPIEVDERLIEMDYGPYEGMDLTKPAPEVLAFFMDFVNVPAPEGMEQLGSVVGRLGGFLCEHGEEARDENILISTHAIAMKGALEYLTPESKGGYWSKHIANCAVYVSEFENGALSVPHELDIS